MSKKISQKTPQKSSSRLRIRGKIYLGCFWLGETPDGTDDYLRPLFLCRDKFLAAVLLREAKKHGIAFLWPIPPSEGAPLRRMMEGGPPPSDWPGWKKIDVFLGRHYAAGVAERADTSINTAKAACRTGADGHKRQLDTVNSEAAA